MEAPSYAPTEDEAAAQPLELEIGGNGQFSIPELVEIKPKARLRKRKERKPMNPRHMRLGTRRKKSSSK